MLPAITALLREIRDAFLALGDSLRSLLVALTILAQERASPSTPRRMLSCIAIEKTSLGPRYTLRQIPVRAV